MNKRVHQIAHDELMADLKRARDSALGETRTLLRRAIVRLERLNEIVNNMMIDRQHDGMGGTDL